MSFTVKFENDGTVLFPAIAIAIVRPPILYLSTLFNVKSCAPLHDSRIQESTHGQRQKDPTLQDSLGVYVKAV